jgi:tRNA(Ile)-lysidine synthase
MSQLRFEQLRTTIEQLLPSAATGELLVAFSGGLDSSVLLHALTARDGVIVDEARRIRVRAAYINHQLHPDATTWQGHCAQVASELGVPFTTQSVTIPANPAEGIESAARAARYEALRSMLRPGEALVTAHHADDQLETVLLALMRGSGVDGLAAMPACRRFGTGWHLRPLLEYTRDTLAHWASERRLSWLDDPSNDSTRFDRNFLRTAIVPRLRERWPSAAQSVVRSAAHLGEAASLLDEVAARDFATATIGGCLKVGALRALEPPRRRNLLRYWIGACGARAPSTRKLAALEHDMLAADEDRSPCVDWDEVEVRRHRGLMYCVTRMPEEAPLDLEWVWNAPVQLGERSGLLRAEIAHGRGIARSKLPDRVRIATRQGGESLRLPGHAHRRSLKNLLQEANVLPWWRNRLPLVYVDGTLIAVADLWVNAEFAAEDREAGVRIVWERRPQIEGLLETS